MDNSVVATFSDNEAADRAKAALLEAGLSPSDISTFLDTATHTPEGLWEKVKNHLQPEEKFRTYTVLTAYADLHSIDRVEEIMSEHGATEVQVHAARPTRIM